MSDASDRYAATPQRDCVMSLGAAIRAHVEPGQHLHFASTPSRSNAAILELGRQYAQAGPTFTVSTTGMHSTAHLLGLLNLARRYIACFFGDNYPIPRPNALYQRLEEAGVDLEQWSLGSYVASFRAGARGEPYAITKSLQGTDLGKQLGRKGLYVELPDPADPARSLSLVKAMQADVTFLHAAAGDADGNALFCPPYCEAFHASLGAKRGTIITVEQVVPRGELGQYPQFLPVPSHRVLAICHAPKGALPQPLHVLPESYRALAYADDTVQYEFWRCLTRDDELFERFCHAVLSAQSDDASASGAFVSEWARTLHSKRSICTAVSRTQNVDAEFRLPTRVDASERCTELVSWHSLSEDARTTLLAARAICSRVIEAKLEVILAGIGQSFAAARLAKILLARHGYAPELLVETGLSDFDPIAADPFLLGYRNIVGSKRLTDVEHVLGTLVCGAGCRSLGVIGAAQVDCRGRINSTRTAGKLLVGSGGANDIASSANEVIVVTRAQPGRLPPTVEYVTSPGDQVRSIVTDRWELHRTNVAEPWRVLQWLRIPPAAEHPSQLPTWILDDSHIGPSAEPPTQEEFEALGRIVEHATGKDQRCAPDTRYPRSAS